MRRFTVVIERDEDGFFVASCPAFPGCFTQGRTYRLVMSRMRSLIKIFAAIRKEEEGVLPEEVGIERVAVGSS